jgi:BarA-like signal transduction histidine kinase
MVAEEVTAITIPAEQNWFCLAASFHEKTMFSVKNAEKFKQTHLSACISWPVTSTDKTKYFIFTFQV